MNTLKTTDCTLNKYKNVGKVFSFKTIRNSTGEEKGGTNSIYLPVNSKSFGLFHSLKYVPEDFSDLFKTMVS